MDGRSNALNQIDKELPWTVGLVRRNVRNLLSYNRGADGKIH